MNVPTSSPIKHRLSLYMSNKDAILVKTWYRFQEQAADVEERMCFLQHIPKANIPEFMKGKRLDRLIDVKGNEGAPIIL